MYSRLSYALIAGILCVQASLGFAGEFQLLSVTAPIPGKVIAEVSLPAEEVPTREAFHLLFDDKNDFTAVEVRAAAASPLQTEVVLAVDQSGSMGRSAVRDIKSAVKTVLSVPRPQITLALIAFGTRTTTLNGMSADIAQAAQAADKLRIEASADGRTKFYEAIGGAMTMLKVSQGTGPKRVVVISDGKDEGSQIRPETIVPASNAIGATVNGIGFGRVAKTTSGSLRDLAEATGGEFVLAHNPTELFDALDRLLSPVPAIPMFEVVFEYKPSGNDRWVKTALVEYKPTGQQGVRRPIAEAVAEPAVEEPAVEKPVKEVQGQVDQEKSVDKQTRDTSKWDWKITIFEINFDARLLLALLSGAIALVAGGFIYYYRYYRVENKIVVTEHHEVAPVVIPQPPRRSATSVSPVFREPRQGKPAAILVATSGPARGNRYAIDRATLRIGESETNDLCITGDDYVSGKHALIKYEWGSLYLSDLGSRNGTWLNGTRLARTAIALTPGDQIRVGKTILELQLAQGPSSEGAPRGAPRGMEPPVS